MPKLPVIKYRITTDQVPKGAANGGMYRVQIVKRKIYADKSTEDQFIAKRHFTKKNDALKWAAEMRAQYKK